MMDIFQYDPFYNTLESVPSTDINPYVKKLKDLSETNPNLFFYSDRLKKLSSLDPLSFSKELFPSSTPTKKLFLEIGSYSGSTLIQLAKTNLDSNFIGMDITFKRTYLTANSIKTSNLSNVTTFLFNAKFLDKLFPQNFLDGIFLFFPDPWKKIKQQKHRLVSKDFVASLYKILKPDAFFWLKTDQLPYFNSTKTLFLDNNFKPIPQISSINVADLSTPFQRTFELKHKDWYEFICSKI